MKRRVQLANIAMDSMNKIWPQRRLHINQKLKIYKTIIKSIMTYNYSTWGLTKAQTEELDRAHRKQLRKLWNDPFKKNRHLYKDSEEVPLSIEMKKARWRALGHMLRLHIKTPCQMAMTDYFMIPAKSKKYPGRKRCTLPTIIDEDLKEANKNNNTIVTKFKTIEDLRKI